MAANPSPRITLRVKDQGGGPVIYARFRWAGSHAEPALGRGWLVPLADELAKPRGKVIGGWVERRGRAPEGFLGVDGAWRLVPEVLDGYARRAEQAAKRRAEEARPRLRDGIDRWLAARQEDDANGEHEGLEARARQEHDELRASHRSRVGRRSPCRHDRGC